MKELKEFFSGVYEGIKEFSHNITVIINSALLSVVYFVGAGATALVARVIGKHFLDIKPNRKSYWTELNLKKKPIEEYYRQF